MLDACATHRAVAAAAIERSQAAVEPSLWNGSRYITQAIAMPLIIVPVLYTIFFRIPYGSAPDSA